MSFRGFQFWEAPPKISSLMSHLKDDSGDSGQLQSCPQEMNGEGSSSNSKPVTKAINKA